MKNLLSLALLVMSFQTFAQPTTLKTGTNGYVTINGTNIQRGTLISRYRVQGADTLLTISLNSPNGIRVYIAESKCTTYLNGDAANVPFYNCTTLRTWMNSRFEPIQSTATIDVGDNVNGATVSTVLYNTSANKLGSSSNLK